MKKNLMSDKSWNRNMRTHPVQMPPGHAVKATLCLNKVVGNGEK